MNKIILTFLPFIITVGCSSLARVPPIHEEDFVGKWTWFDFGNFYSITWDVDPNRPDIRISETDESLFIMRAMQLCDSHISSRDYHGKKIRTNEWTMPVGGLYIPVSYNKEVDGGNVRCKNIEAHNKSNHSDAAKAAPGV